MIRLDLGSIPEGLSELELSADASQLEATLEGGRFDSPVRIEIRVNRKEKDIFLKGKARVEVVLECARCLEEHALVLESPVELCCIIGGAGADQEPGGDRENVIEVPGGTKYIDLADHIRSELLVLVPLKPLCCEDCKGLCPKCGANLNLASCSCQPGSSDSRWNALKDLK